MAARMPIFSAQGDSRLQKLKLLRQRMCDLQAEIAGLEAQLTSEEIAVFPIQTIPAEVLSMIFSQYLHDNPRLIRRLLLVCRRWYDTAINDPKLWTIIKLNIESGEKKSGKKGNSRVTISRGVFKTQFEIPS